MKPPQVSMCPAVRHCPARPSAPVAWASLSPWPRPGLGAPRSCPRSLRPTHPVFRSLSQRRSRPRRHPHRASTMPPRATAAASSSTRRSAPARMRPTRCPCSARGARAPPASPALPAPSALGAPASGRDPASGSYGVGPSRLCQPMCAARCRVTLRRLGRARWGDAVRGPVPAGLLPLRRVRAGVLRGGGRLVRAVPLHPHRVG